jgi:hypothetical protein
LLRDRRHNAVHPQTEAVRSFADVPHSGDGYAQARRNYKDRTYEGDERGGLHADSLLRHIFVSE